MPTSVSSTIIQYSGPLSIAIGSSVRSNNWNNVTATWSKLVERFSNPVVTKETMAQYQSMEKLDKTRAKDVGGYVGGYMSQSQRRKDSVIYRQIVTLDADSCPDVWALWSVFGLVFPHAAVFHSTHSHTPGNPRLRLVIPLSEPVKFREYEKLAKYIASELGEQYFDKTTYEPNRLMFWPSVPKDCLADYVFDYIDAPWLNPGPIIKKIVKQELQEQVLNSDPTKLPGIPGLFNKKYDIHKCIETFLPDIYFRAREDRYKYTEADSSAGLVVYEGGKFAYSHHAKDPAGGKLMNAYELLLTHKFDGNQNNCFSFLRTNGIIELSAWPEGLELNSKGQPKSTIANMQLILDKDTVVGDKMLINDMSGKLMVYGDFPWIGFMDRTSFEWQDEDDAGLRCYMEACYGLTDKDKLYDAILLSANERRMHPIREHLNKLEWDGMPRLDTLLVDFLGADNSPYVRSVTRKALIGAIARVMQPGVKHDHVLVLVGPQGCRKSSTIKALGGEWYTDSLYTMQGKDAFEQIQGFWIIELSEMTAVRKTDLEQMKQFVSKQSDNYRAAYARRTVDRKRQCAFIGSTNDAQFLKDMTGNRRFWPVDVCKVPLETYKLLTKEYVDQIWAEALVAYKAGEQWYLDEKMEEEAKVVQEQHTEDLPLTGAIQEFLSQKVPVNWYKMSAEERMQWYATKDIQKNTSLMKRDKVCALEIWQECLHGLTKEYTPAKARDICNILRKIPGWTYHPSPIRVHNYGQQRAFVTEDYHYLK